MATYRSGHIRENSIAMVPVHGYINKTNYSRDSIQWLDFVAFTENLQIQHALNKTGEHKIAGISVDGFCEATKTIYQYHVRFVFSFKHFFKITVDYIVLKNMLY